MVKGLDATEEEIILVLACYNKKGVKKGSGLEIL